MGNVINSAGKNVIQKGTIIYREHDEINYILIIYKGHVLAQNAGHKMVLSAGGFIGLSDFYREEGAMYSYGAMDEVTVLAYPVTDDSAIRTIAEEKSDYRSLMILALLRHIENLSKKRAAVMAHTLELSDELSDIEARYIELCRAERKMAASLKNVKTQILPDDNIEDDLIAYQKERLGLSSDIIKGYYGASIGLCLYEIPKLAELINDLNESIEANLDFAQKVTDLVMADGKSLFSALGALALDLPTTGGGYKKAKNLIERFKNAIEETESFYENNTGSHLRYNKHVAASVYDQVFGKSEEQMSKKSVMTPELVLYELSGSLQKITDYSRLPIEVCDEFIESIDAFVGLKNKLASDDEARAIRGRVSKSFYDVYEAVFFNALMDNRLPPAVKLFLNFGYVDERLIEKEQLIALAGLDTDTEELLACNIYTLFEWLREIYEGRREPSKSEVDFEYQEFLREERKCGRLNEETLKAASVDRKKKIHYEIVNMFRQNSRITNGQISVFVPVLCQEQLQGPVSKLLLKKELLDRAVQDARELDYSVFYRPILFYDKTLGLDKEYIMQEVFPDIILLPNFGQNASMWQEISEKRRDTPGRFMFPIFLEGRLNDLVIRCLGKYRWDLCRTLQGNSWNNITEKSLTSEYYDYLQYYKKNHDLSDDRKEKVRQQLVKAKNVKRDVFAMDYEVWMKFESSGSVRLNKPVREMMAMYCPFNKAKREELCAVSMYRDAFARYDREKQKTVKNLESRYRAVAKEREIPPELKENLEFNRDR